MATTTPTTPSKTPSDPTFRHYTASQASSYQTGRPAYPDALTQTIVNYHTASGGQLDTLLDVGCGPGTATHSFAPHFSRAFGVDPSVEMINAASALGSVPPGTPATLAPAPQTTTQIHYAVSAAESLPGPSLAAHLPPESVDLLTAATAAHWFDMALFWPRTSLLVRHGGTVALWTGVGYYCHPHTTPNAREVQAVLDRLEHETLAPYKTRGKRD